MTTSPTRLSHVVLKSPDPKALMDWYCDVLGGEIIFDSPFFVFMTYDEEHHRVAAMLSGEPSAKSGTGLMHMAFGFDTVGQLLDHYERLADSDTEPATAIHHGPTISFYYKDIDGNVLEFFVDTMPADEATEFMRGPIYAGNPVGYEIDPKDMAKARANGVADDEITVFDSEREVDVMAVLSKQMELLG